MKSPILGTALAVLVVVATGCGGASGPQRIPVYGKLTVNGQPVPRGSVMARPAEGSPGVGAVGKVEGGEYRFDDVSGPQAGKYILVFNLQASGKVTGAAPSRGAKPVDNDRATKFTDGIEFPGGTAQFEVPIDVPAEGELKKDIDLVSKKP